MMPDANLGPPNLLLALTLCLGVPVHDAFADPDPQCRTQPLRVLDLEVDGYVPLGDRGTVTLCQRANGLAATVVVDGVKNEVVYSAWWIYRTGPIECANPSAFDWSWSCGWDLLFEVGEDDEQPVFGRIGSNVATRSGRVRWQDSMRGFRPPAGAAIAILVMEHGEAQWDDGKRLARQRLTPERWFWGSPGLGNFFDYYTKPWVWELAWTQFVIE